jgi:histone deacetylase complex regulatory component SIN3
VCSQRYKSQAIDQAATQAAVDEVITLFHGHDKLLIGFKPFVPDGANMDLSGIEQISSSGDTTVLTANVSGAVHLVATILCLQAVLR